MKHLLKSKTLAEARREVYGMLDEQPYKIVMGRRYVDPDKSSDMEMCYYVFETKEDYQKWLTDDKYEHQVNGSQVLRDLNRNPSIKMMFNKHERGELIEIIKRTFGCTSETARWAYKGLAAMYDKSVIRINE